MNLGKAIQELCAEKERLERVIASLEELQRGDVVVPVLAQAPKRRGRKSMNPQERQEVSGRMKKYWDARRKQQQAQPKHPAAQGS
jgi:hypothetical protein